MFDIFTGIKTKNPGCLQLREMVCEAWQSSSQISETVSSVIITPSSEVTFGKKRWLKVPDLGKLTYYDIQCVDWGLPLMGVWEIFT